MPGNNDFNPSIWRKKPNQHRAVATVDAILVAANELFASQGYYKTTTNHIAEKAGVGIGSLYDYFPNREAIAMALMEETAASISNDIRSLFNRHFDEKIETIVPIVFTTIFNWHKEHQNILIKLANEAPELRQTAQMLSIEKLISRTGFIYMSEHQQEFSVENLDAAYGFISLAVIASIKQYLADPIKQVSEEQFLDNLIRMGLLFLKAELRNNS